MTPIDRRELLKGVLGASVLAASARAARVARAEEKPRVAIATWAHGLPAVKRALELLGKDQPALDAVEQGVVVVEDDPENQSVGRGGLPNRDGVVQLDAAVMRGADLMVGAVACLERIKNPVSVARRVLEKTNHVLLVGEGARAFARSQGFQEEEFLSEKSRAAWEKWKKEQEAPRKDHDTVGLIALDGTGEIAVAVSTSGLAWKLPGRVGDSPIVGAGYYADSKVGAAAATGIGEEVLRVAGSFLVVEGMRRGLEPRAAIDEALGRIRANPPRVPDQHSRQVGFIALRRDGEAAAASLEKGFQYALGRVGGSASLLDAPSLG